MSLFILHKESNTSPNMESKAKNKKRESIYSKVHGFEVKENEHGDLIRGGYIATTHLDSGFYDGARELHVKDKIALSTLEKWSDEINRGVPRSNKVSIHHEREPHVAGVGLMDSARVDLLPDGEYGLYVDTLIDKTKENFEDTQYRIEKGLIDSFSIEFRTKDQMTSDYLPGAVIETEIENGVMRELLPGTELEGWTLASQPMNENCVMLKEIIKNSNENKEEIKMSEEEKSPDSQTEEEPVEEEPVEEEKTKVVTSLETKETKISSEDIKFLKEMKTLEAKKSKEKELSEIREKVKDELKEELKEVQIESKVKSNKGDDEDEKKEVIEYKEIFDKESKIDVKEQFLRAGRLVTPQMFSTGTMAESKEFKHFSTNGTKLEFKGLGITSNQQTDTDYLLSAAELSDVFDPVIYNALNEATLTWNILQKDDFSQKGNNQVQFTLKIRGNLSAGAYTGNSVNLGNTKREKFMTKFKKYMVGVEVDGDMIAAARGGPVGDIFSLEVKDSTDTLMSEMNKDLFKEQGSETGAPVIGFEYITDGVGNGTLYNVTRSAANKLLVDTATDSYINGSSADITISNLRKAVRQPKDEGAGTGNLVWVTSYIQGDKFRSIYDAAQRPVPTSARFGFEGRPELDGIPIFEDKDCNDDDWWLIDIETHRIAVWVPPTLEMLGKDADSQKGFIKTYWGVFNRAPRRMVQIYGNATS